MKRIAILGSTGSIGRSALSVVAAHPARLEVVGLAAGRNVERFAEQVAGLRPAVVALADDEALERLRASGALSDAAAAGSGEDGLVRVATHPRADLVLCASSGPRRSAPRWPPSRRARRWPWPTRKCW